MNDFYIGTTIELTYPIMPTDSNSLTLYLVNNTENISFSYEPDLENNQFILTLQSYDTENLTPSNATYIIELSNGDTKTLIDTGTVNIKANPSLLDNFDNRTHAKRVLDAIEAVIEGRATRDEMKYNINGRYLEKTPLPDLLQLRDRYKREYNNELKAERIKKGLGANNIIRTRFK